MLWLMTLVVCLLAGCALHEPPPQTGPPGPEDLSTWATPEIVSEPLGAPRKRSTPQADPKPTPAEKVYPYAPGGVYAVSVSVDAPLDIQFQPGEEIHGYIDSRIIEAVPGSGTGEQSTQASWAFKQGVSGVGDTKRGHVFVTVADIGLKNGVTIATTRGVYAVTLTSVKSSPIRYLRWTHELEPVEVVSIEPHEQGPLPPFGVPRPYRVGYQIKSTSERTPDWLPRQAVDDGKKVYVLLPQATLYGTSPLVRKIGPNGPMVVNVRQYLNVLIVDELAAQLELRVGQGETAEVVQVFRGELRIIHCPQDPACPHFPHLGGQS